MRIAGSGNDTILTLSLQFDSDIAAHVRSRIWYAFRVYSAVYGHKVVENPIAAAVRCSYGQVPSTIKGDAVFHIPALYQSASDAGARPVFAKCRYAGEQFHLRHGLDKTSAKPDWLAEIFHWLSSGYEAHIVARDEIGRIPYAETVFSREGLSPRKPHATLLMAWMENALQNGSEVEGLPRAPSPVPGVEHLILSSHDIDFYYVNCVSAFVRLIKNLAIAVRVYRSWPYFRDNLKMIFQLSAGKRIGDYVPALLAAASELEVQSTFFVVSRGSHRRDPNYRLDQIAARLAEAEERGFTTGVHGSYRSVMEDSSLREEAGRLANKKGEIPIAGRQHWLRFSKHQDLFAEVEKAGLLVESTLGFPDMVGFRNGASFAFPPYDFERETAHEFLEVPLALMDGSLQSASTNLQLDATELAEEVLAESRKLGWGCVSVLWHNPVEPLSVPAEINRVFWALARNQKAHREKWMGAEQFLSASLLRYQQAGLLQGVRFGEYVRVQAAAISGSR